MVILKLSLAFLRASINKANLRDGFRLEYFLRSHANYVNSVISDKNNDLYSVWFGDTQVWLNEHWGAKECIIDITIGEDDDVIRRKYKYKYELDTLYEEFHRDAIKRVIDDVLRGKFIELEIRILRYLCRHTINFPEDFEAYGAPSSP